MKKRFTSPTGHEGMTIDCGIYEVEIFKSIEGAGNCIAYTHKETKNSIITPFAFDINWDEESDGGKISLKQRDRWGSGMEFFHFDPTDLKGMFEFIAYGYFKDKFTEFKNGK